MPVLLLFLFLFGFTENQTDVVKITANPQKIYIEKTNTGQKLNFDFIVENTSNESLILDSVQVSVLDVNNKIILRKFIDGNGVSPSIRTVPNRTIETGKNALIFNPFYSFSDDIQLHKMQYEFRFQNTGGDKEYNTKIEVSPFVYETKTNLILPLKGRTIIYDGHDFYAHHRRFDFMFEPIHAFGFNSNFMRYSYDMCPVNEQGAMFSNDESKNENWFGFGMPIYAPGEGKVAVIVNNYLDNRRFDESVIAGNREILHGNYIVIDHQNGEFSVFSHLRKDSVKVKVGDMVKQGQQIAGIGASGSANIPHLHYELQTAVDSSAEGLPSYFRNFRRILGAKKVYIKYGQIDSGDIIER